MTETTKLDKVILEINKKFGGGPILKVNPVVITKELVQKTIAKK